MTAPASRKRRRRPSGPGFVAAARQAYGIRTFTLLGLFGVLAAAAGAAVVAVGLACVGALVVLGYRRTSATDPGTTTEVAALATYLLGVLTWTTPAAAGALAVVVVALLMSKARLHRFVAEAVSDVEMEDGLKFLVGAFVVLPLLPRRDLGPYGILNPARIWLIVVAVTGVSWIGYVAVRLLGSRRGLNVAGLAGGFISAVATTLAMGRRVARGGDVDGAVAGALSASIATFLELAVIVTAVSPAVGAVLAPACAIGALSLVLSARAAGRRAPARPGEVAERTSRIVTLGPALTLAAILTIALLAARWARALFGPRGAVLAIAIAGLGDAHGGSITAATLQSRGALAISATILAIGAAVTTNTVVKCVAAYVAARGPFFWRFTRGVGVSLLLFVGTLGLSVWVAS